MTLRSFRWFRILFSLSKKLIYLRLLFFIIIYRKWILNVIIRYNIRYRVSLLFAFCKKMLIAFQFYIQIMNYIFKSWKSFSPWYYVLTAFFFFFFWKKRIPFSSPAHDVHRMSHMHRVMRQCSRRFLIISFFGRFRNGKKNPNGRGKKTLYILYYMHGNYN